jgi:DNA polymerase-4
LTTPERHRWIAHVDLDAFFASCEQRDEPAYRGRPVVVGALPGGRGVVAAASYEAREYGIHSAMPIAEAYRRCPDAVYVRPDHDKYQRESRRIFALLKDITPRVEAASIDEAYLDVSGLERLVGPPEKIGQDIKQKILDATGLTASVGIGPNRLIAKLGSEHRKPDGLTVVAPDDVADFLAPMPVSNLRGVGRKTLPHFERLHIHTVAELRAASMATLEEEFGPSTAAKFLRQAHGIASDEVVTDRQRKSISKERTFEHDLTDDRQLKDRLQELSAGVARIARREGLAGRVVTLKIRFAGFETHTRQRKLPGATWDERVLLDTGWSLYRRGDLPKKSVRLIGIGLSDWSKASPQDDLFAQTVDDNPDDRLLETIDAVNARFGGGKLRLGLRRDGGD